MVASNARDPGQVARIAQRISKRQVCTTATRTIAARIERIERQEYRHERCPAVVRMIRRVAFSL